MRGPGGHARSTSDVATDLERRRTLNERPQPEDALPAANGRLWLLPATAVTLVIAVEAARALLSPRLDDAAERLWLAAAVTIVLLLVVGALLTVLFRLQRQLERRSRELEALNRAGLGIHGELSLGVVLQKVVDQARQLLGARYGAVAVIDQPGHIREFVTSGIGADERRRIGDPPTGRGLLGVVLNEGQRLRLSDLTEHPRAAGFPEHHPPMHSLLAVPIVCDSPCRGNLYVAEAAGGRAFTVDDEETLTRFAVKAAAAIDNAHLHQRLKGLAVAEERARIAREMHDGMAQVLAYVNTKAQAVKEFLRHQRVDEASAQLEQLAAAAREIYTDVREGILALHTQASPDRSLPQALREFLQSWQDHSGIVGELIIAGDPHFGPEVELQLLRIIQEALANVRKHSGASHAVVEIRGGASAIEVEVRDDGSGFDPAAMPRAGLPRFGLAIMRERAESIGGSMKLDTSPGAGTRVRVALPSSLQAHLESPNPVR